MNYKIVFILSLSLTSCSRKSICIDEAKINKEAMCIQVYAPVCGCDGKTYGNSCEATNSGIVEFKEGECP